MSTVAVHQLKILYTLRGCRFYYGAEVSFISLVTVLTQPTHKTGTVAANSVKSLIGSPNDTAQESTERTERTETEWSQSAPAQNPALHCPGQDWMGLVGTLYTHTSHLGLLDKRGLLVV